MRWTRPCSCARPLGLGLMLGLGLVLTASAAVRSAPADAVAAEDRELALQLEQAGSLTAAAALVNAQAVLAGPVHLRFASCPDANAWYEPERREVRLCLELARQLAGVLAAQLDDEAQMLQALDGALRFIALHELGHALVEQLRLPITGREEDAVDQFAAWLLLGDADSASLLSAASVFASQISGGEDVTAAHSLDRQRYFNLLCWVYGSDPASRASLIEDWSLPGERAAGCVDEYAQLGRSWSRLLAAHAPRPGPAAPAGPRPPPPDGAPTGASGAAAGDPARSAEHPPADHSSARGGPPARRP